jgi:site-specific DNA-methyltransferase (adenine-specific)
MENTFICEDAIEGIKKLQKKSIDFILIDPPYNISDYESSSGVRKVNNLNKGGFLYKYKYCDLVIADWDFKPMNPEIFPEMYRVLRNGGSLACFYDIWKMGQLRQNLIDCKFHQFRVCEWIKDNPTPINSKNNYLSNAKEYFLFCVKDWCPTFNSKYDNGNYHAPLCHPPERKHPTQKPLKLITEILLKHTKEGDTVLDCYAGAGTTAVACKNTNRNYICFEINKDYCEMAKERLSNITK